MNSFNNKFSLSNSQLPPSGFSFAPAKKLTPSQVPSINWNDF